MPLKVGTVVKLKVPCLSNPVNTLGVCYSVDYILHRPSFGIIFKNGYYDGFSPEEINIFLEIIKEQEFSYQFVNVIKLSNDFKNGIFNKLLQI